MSASEISNLVKNLHLLVLPSTLWAVHFDPQQEFLAILHVNINCDKILIDKGVLLTRDNCSVKASVTLNDEIVDLPIASKIESITDLTSLIYSLHYAKVCLNENVSPKCAKYVFNSASDLCDYCSFEVFSQSCKDINTIQPMYLQNVSYENDIELDNDDLTSKPEKSKFLCTKCGKTFASASSLDHHMPTHAPPDDKPFKCKVCTKAFAKKYNLNVHTRVHSGERPYVCSKCGKTYSTRSNLSTHMNSAHCDEKRHRCEFCDMTFVHPRLLRIHMRKHTGEKPFMCQICGKVFSKNIHLTIHIRTHTGEKPYACPLCGKSFTTTGNLSMHKKINHKI